ncbi:MAG: RodZ domain-containing protein [Syntrophomonas sp.]
MDFGNKLKEERERQGYSLEAVEEETKIRKAYIKALEDEEFSLLPPRVYATGFLKLYAGFLKLDAEEMVNEFKLLAYGAQEEEESFQVPEATKESGFNWPSNLNLKRILTAGMFLVLVIWMGNNLANYFASRGANEQTQPRPSVSQQQPEKRAKPPQVAVKTAEVVIEATQKCWLRIVVDDQQQYEGMLLPGQTKSFIGKKTVLVNAGNAGGINITFNNKNLGPMGTPGEVLEKVFSVDKPGTE